MNLRPRELLAGFPLGLAGVVLCLLAQVDFELRLCNRWVVELPFLHSAAHDALKDLLGLGMMTVFLVASWPLLARPQEKRGPLVRWRPRSAPQDAPAPSPER